jgi:pyruvate/2-oxoglutarate dehydrogenase complex dihydrolipoamide acyltransferase (E2) component
MKQPIIMPQMGQSVAEGTIIRWLRRPGEPVKADDVLVEIESDKITVAVESPFDGVLSAVLKQPGDHAAVGEAIGLIETVVSSTPAPRPHGAACSEPQRVQPADADASPVPPAASHPPATWLSPAVMRLALDHNLGRDDLARIPRTGRHGRLTRADVLRHLGQPADVPPAADGQVVPMSSIRRTIADHMVQSIRTSAHVTMVHAVDMTTVAALRAAHKHAFAAAHGVKLTYTAVLLFVTARVLRDFPVINASVRGSDLVLHKDINVGCAVALPDESLVVPVVRHADTRSFPDIARELDRLIDLSRRKALRREDITGGTFTLSNFGSFGSLIGTPIIHQPQVAILGIGAVRPAPVVADGSVTIRDQVYLSLTFDHRVIDGAMGGRFLNAIQTQTEHVSAATLDL